MTKNSLTPLQARLARLHRLVRYSHYRLLVGRYTPFRHALTGRATTVAWERHTRLLGALGRLERAISGDTARPCPLCLGTDGPVTDGLCYWCSKLEDDRHAKSA